MSEKPDKKYLIPLLWTSLGIIIFYTLYRVIRLFII